jgi:hypothetical protein
MSYHYQTNRNLPVFYRPLVYFSELDIFFIEYLFDNKLKITKWGNQYSSGFSIHYDDGVEKIHIKKADISDCLYNYFPEKCKNIMKKYKNN